jgi:hypothetical protein
MVVVPSKPFWKSATIWSNIAVFVATTIPIVTAGLGDLLTVEQALTAATVLGMANAMLQVFIRIFMTNSAISGTNTGG